MKGLITLLATLLSTAAAQSCGGDYENVAGVCYYISTVEETWEGARTACQNSAPEGKTAGLAHLEHCQNLRELWAHIMTNYEVVDYWIGGSDELGPEGVFRWDSTGELVPVEVPFWFPGQPDGYTNENYLSLSKTGYFADENGDLTQRYICKIL